MNSTVDKWSILAWLASVTVGVVMLGIAASRGPRDLPAVESADVESELRELRYNLRECQAMVMLMSHTLNEHGWLNLEYQPGTLGADADAASLLGERKYQPGTERRREANGVYTR